MNPGLTILALALVVGVAFGLYRRRVDGRFSTSSAAAVPVAAGNAPAPGADPADPADPVVDAEAWAHVSAALPAEQLGEHATLLQFSSAFCAPCRTTRVVLADVAARYDGVTHLEVDAEKHLDLVRALDVRRTPTTLVLDAHGREITRAAGAPRREQVLAALPTSLQEQR